MNKKQMIQRMEELKRCSPNLKEQIMGTILTSEDEVMPEEITTVIANSLDKLSIPSDFVGYCYLKTAIELLIEGKIPSKFSITRDVYPEVAKLHHKNVPQIENSIRHAIQVGFIRGDWEIWNNIFGFLSSFENGKPTKSEFIATLEEYIESTIRTNEINALIATSLHKLGISSNLDGYSDLRTAIKLLIEGEISSKFSITRDVYPKVAKLHHKTVSQVERAIRYAINVGCIRGDLELWRKLLGCSFPFKTGKPTNLKVLLMLAEYIKHI